MRTATKAPGRLPGPVAGAWGKRFFFVQNDVFLLNLPPFEKRGFPEKEIFFRRQCYFFLIWNIVENMCYEEIFS